MWTLFLDMVYRSCDLKIGECILSVCANVVNMLYFFVGVFIMCMSTLE